MTTLKHIKYGRFRVQMIGYNDVNGDLVQHITVRIVPQNPTFWQQMGIREL